MATPAAILSILVDVNSGKASVALAGVQKQLVTTNTHADQLEKHSGKLSKTLGGISAPAEKSRHSLTHLAEAALAAGAAFEGFRAAKEAVETTVELGHATERLSAITGLDIKTSSTWIEAMKVRGVQTKQVGMAFITLSRNIRNAEDGSKTAKKAFDELGISQKSLATEDTQTTLLRVADAMHKLDDPTRRAALAQQLFGRGAQALVPVLAQGRKGVEEMLATSQKLGAFLPNSTKAFEGAVDAQRQMALAADGLRIAFATAVLPTLVKVSQAVLGFIEQMRTGQGAGGQFAQILTTAFAKVKDAVGFLVGVLKDLFQAFQANNPIVVAAAGAIAGIAVSLEAATKAQAAFNLLAEANPYVRIATLVAALAGALALLYEKNQSVHKALDDAWTRLRTIAETVFPVIRDIATRAFTIIVGAANALRDAFNAVFPVAKRIVLIAFDAIMVAVDLLKAQFQIAWDIIGPLVRRTIDAIKFAINNILIPVFQQLKGPLQTLGSVFSTVFNKVHDVVKFAMDFMLGAFASFLRVVADVASVKLPFLGKVFGNAADSINNAADSVDKLKQQLDGIPPKVSTEVDVKINFLSNVVGAISSIGATITNVGAKVAAHYTGGLVTQPGYFAGEEAPKHPEVILATNPAYRDRNIGLWQTAGHMLGIPGFASGGLANAGAMVAATDPWAQSHAGSWAAGKAKTWVHSQFPSAGAMGGGSGVSAGVGGAGVPAGSPRDWLTKALQITNHYSPSNLAALYGRMLQESGGSPHAINLWDSNAAAGHPSKGLLQTIDSTFNTYALPGYGNIWNPIANAIAAIRYMFAGYGHIVGPSGSGYRKGGIHGKIPGFAKGGIPSAGSIIGLPALPTLAGAGPQTATGIRGVAGTISGTRGSIASLEQSFSAIDSFYNLNSGASFVDPDTGLRDENAIKARVDQLNTLIAYRQRIFAAWGMVVALTQRLIEANERMARVLNAVAQSITTKGLKGNALTSAQKRLSDTKAAAAQYATNAGAARGALSGAIGDRQSAWISLQSLLGEKFTTAGTVSQPVAAVTAALDNSPVTDPATIALLQAQVQQANLRTAVSQAQYATLPFGGSFATGGIVPGALGMPSVIVAHGGETVTPAGQMRVVIEDHRTRVYYDDVEQIVNQVTRGSARNASRSLPGSR